MNRADLRTAIIEDTHRPDLNGLVDRFIRQGEGLIRRQVTAYPLSYVLTESDRAADGIYTLPSGVQIIRSLQWRGRNIRDGLARVSIDSLNRLSAQADPQQYAQLSINTVDIRGVPPTDSEIDLLYFGMPEPLVNPEDTNQLLEDHETLYISAAKFHVYIHTQDRELAQDELQIFNGVAETLNEQTDRQFGGESITQTYDFSGGSTY